MIRVVRDRIDGIAEPLPAGEQVLWSERPEGWPFAFRLLQLRWVAGWFALLAVWRGVDAWQEGGSVLDVLSRASSLAPLALAGFGLLAALGWLMARNSTYALTGERLVLQTGIALPITINLPLRLIDGVAVRPLRDGRADVILTLAPQSRLQALALWPHMQGWQTGTVQPVLRDLSAQAHATLVPVLAAALRNTDPAAVATAATRAAEPGVAGSQTAPAGAASIRNGGGLFVHGSAA